MHNQHLNDIHRLSRSHHLVFSRVFSALPLSNIVDPTFQQVCMGEMYYIKYISIISIIITFYRSQKTNTLQKDLGLYMHQHGLSRTGINNGPIFGFSVAPRTVDRHNKNLREQYPSFLQQKIQHTIKVNQIY